MEARSFQPEDKYVNDTFEFTRLKGANEAQNNPVNINIDPDHCQNPPLADYFVC